MLTGPNNDGFVVEVVPVIKNVKAPTPLVAVTDTVVVVAVHVTAKLENVKSVGLFKGAKTIACIGDKQPLASLTTIRMVCVV